MDDRKTTIDALITEILGVAIGKDESDIATIRVHSQDLSQTEPVGLIVGVNLRRTTPDILAVIEVLQRLIDNRAPKDAQEDEEFETPGFDIGIEIKPNP